MSFSKCLVSLLALSVSVSALATPHIARNVHHRGLVPRTITPVAVEAPIAPPSKRALSKRCKARSAQSAAASTALSTSSPSVVVSSAEPESTKAIGGAIHVPSSSKAVGGDSTVAHAKPSSTPEAEPTTVVAAKPTSTKAAEPVSSVQPETSSTKTTKPVTSVQPEASSTKVAKPTTQTTSEASSTKSAAPKPSATPASGGGSQPSFLSGTQTGQGTFYATGLGACGITNQDSDHIVAVSRLLFDTYPGYNGVNPNNNPVCNKKITATYEGKSVTVTVTDRCQACAMTDLDFSPSAFNLIADPSLGRISGVQWKWA